MDAESCLDDAQNAIDQILSGARPSREEQIQLALVQAQMATALAIMEQTEAIKANYRMAHEAIEKEQAYTARLPTMAGLNEAIKDNPHPWPELNTFVAVTDKIVHTTAPSAAMIEHDRSQIHREPVEPVHREPLRLAQDMPVELTFQDGRRTFRVGDRVLVLHPEGKAEPELGILQEISLQDVGRELVIRLEQGTGDLIQVGAWDIDPVEETKP